MFLRELYSKKYFLGQNMIKLYTTMVFRKKMTSKNIPAPLTCVPQLLELRVMATKSTSL